MSRAGLNHPIRSHQPFATACWATQATVSFSLCAGPYLTRDQKRRLKEGTFRGWEIVDNTARLCTKNLCLHGIDPDIIEEGAHPPVTIVDSLISTPEERFA